MGQASGFGVFAQLRVRNGVLSIPFDNRPGVFSLTVAINLHSGLDINKNLSTPEHSELSARMYVTSF